jgi:hypothetical protein
LFSQKHVFSSSLLFYKIEKHQNNLFFKFFKDLCLIHNVLLSFLLLLQFKLNKTRVFFFEKIVFNKHVSFIIYISAFRQSPWEDNSILFPNFNLSSFIRRSSMYQKECENNSITRLLYYMQLSVPVEKKTIE